MDKNPARNGTRPQRLTHTPAGDQLRPGKGSSASARVERRRAASTRIRRAVREFLLLPAIVVLAYAGLGVLSILLDKSPPGWLQPLQRSLASFISHSAASSLLSGIATSVVTVTSITFSVLLLAVQQTASAMTPAVFDQFLRRRTNQLYLGMFVGLSMYAFLVLASIGPKSTPAFGATVALLLTVVAFAALIVLIYSTVDQMRPTSVTQVIHDRVLRARVNEMRLLARTRRQSCGSGDVRVDVSAGQDGYVTEFDLDAIAAAMPDSEGSEVVLLATLGDHVAYGQVIATVIDDEEATSERTAEVVRKSVHLDRERKLDDDPSFGVDELANIAWTALSTAKQNPQTGRDATDRLRDLAMRWGPEQRNPRGDDEPLRIVYPDHDLRRVIEALLALLVVCAESRQLESCVHTLYASADVISAAPEHLLCEIEPTLVRTLETVTEHPLIRTLEEALEHLAATLETRGLDDAAERARELAEAMVSSPSRV